MTSELAILCPRGAVPFLIQELAELGITATEGGIDWARATVTSDTAQQAIITSSLLTTRLLRILAQTKTLEEMIPLAHTVRPTDSFAVRADGPDRQVIQEDVGGAIKTGSGATVNLSKPSITYFVHDDSESLLLGEQIGGELGKRHYKIITGAFSLAGPVAASILRISGWNPKEALVAWPCATGELAIEAAFRASTKSPRAYELKNMTERETGKRVVAADPRLAMVSSAQKNAKIAGIEGHIRFSRQDLDWLDTKHDEKGIDTMVGILPNLRLAPKFVPELFYQLDFILANGGVACFACVNDDSVTLIEEGIPKAERAYTLSRTYIWSGQQAISIVSLTAAGKRKKQKKTVPT